jgi:hypothetical protein
MTTQNKYFTKMKSKILLLSISLFFVSMQFFGQDINRSDDPNVKTSVSASKKLNLDESFKSQNSLLNSDSVEDLIEVLRLKLTCDATTYYDESFVVFDDTDPNEGAIKIMSMYDTAPELWSVKNGKNYSISFLGCLDSVTEVPITVKAGVPGNYTLTASQVESFASNMEVSLEDRATGIYTNLGISTEYIFPVNKAVTMADRFFLHFVDLTLDPNKTITSLSENQADQPFNIYAADGAIKIISTQQQSAKIAVFNMLGQRIATGLVGAGANTQINMKGNTGVYIVSVQSSKGISNTKILVR